MLPFIAIAGEGTVTQFALVFTSIVILLMSINIGLRDHLGADHTPNAGLINNLILLAMISQAMFLPQQSVGKSFVTEETFQIKRLCLNFLSHNWVRFLGVVFLGVFSDKLQVAALTGDHLF